MKRSIGERTACASSAGSWPGYAAATSYERDQEKSNLCGRVMLI
jgi:hypothetical protein